MDVMYYLVVVLAFLSTALMIEGVFTLWRAHHGPVAKRIARRLLVATDSGTGQAGPLLKQRRMSDIPALDLFLQEAPFMATLDRLLRQAGSSLVVLQFFGLVLACMAAGAILGALVSLPVELILLVAAAAGCGPGIWIARMRSERLVKIDQQLPDVLDLMSRALRAGHSFTSALQMAATEGPDPTAQEFRIAFEEISFGIATQDAMLHLAARVPSNDLRYMVVAVIAQRETGGNLAELLSNTATLIRNRHKLLGSVRVLATEGKLSAWILVLLPFVLAALMQMINPEFMKTLWTDPAGIKVTVSALMAMVIGVFWMWRIVKIRV